jgi:hypothetical protein
MSVNKKERLIQNIAYTAWKVKNMEAERGKEQKRKRSAMECGT